MKMAAIPWENDEKRNYICMDHIVNDIVSKELRKFFKQKWNRHYQASLGAWDDTNISGQQLCNLKKTRSRPSIYQSQFESGDTSQWDCSVLCAAILYSNSHLSQTEKKAVVRLRETRNAIKHTPDGKLSDTDFQDKAYDVEKAFKSLGISINEISQVKVQKNFYKTFQHLPPRPTHQVVYRTQMITAICQALQKLHSDNDGKLTYFYISGNPGSGKSQLARQVCENICENVFLPTETTFVMTLDAKDLRSLRNSYEDFCRRLNCDGNILESVIKSTKSDAEKIKDLRSQIETRIRNWQRWLFVVDNVENLEDIACLLPQIGDEVWRNGQIVLTTQNTTYVPPDSSFTKHVSISRGMNDQECRQLLSFISGSDQNDALLDKVAKHLDRQPLEIAAAAIYYKRVTQTTSEFSWDDYLKKLEDGKGKDRGQELLKINPAYKSTMSTAVFLAVEKSAENDFILKQIFQFLSLVSFEQMPLDLISYYIDQVDENVDRSEILLTTQQCSLFLPSESDDYDVRFHRVVHEAIKLFCDGDLTVTETSPQCRNSSKGLITVTETSPQCRNSSKGLRVDVLAKIRKVLRTLFRFEDRTDQVKLIPHLKVFTTAVQKLFAQNDALYLITSAFNNKNEVSNIYLFFGRILTDHFCCHLSIEYQKANLRMSLEEKVPFCHAIYNGLGTSHYHLGELERAKEFYDQALEICRKQLGSNHPDTANTLNNLGVMYNKAGELEKAKEFHEEAMEIRIKNLRQNHPDLADSLHNLGVLCHKAGELEKAKKFHEQALKIRSEQLSPNHPDIAATLNNLGILHYKAGELGKAKELQEQALKIRRERLGPYHPDIARSLNNLGILYDKAGELEKAKEFHELALEIRRKQLDPDHPDTPETWNNLGILDYEAMELETAKEVLEQVPDIREKCWFIRKPDKRVIVRSSCMAMAHCCSKERIITNRIHQRAYQREESSKQNSIWEAQPQIEENL